MEKENENHVEVSETAKRKLDEYNKKVKLW